MARSSHDSRVLGNIVMGKRNIFPLYYDLEGKKEKEKLMGPDSREQGTIVGSVESCDVPPATRVRSHVRRTCPRGRRSGQATINPRSKYSINRGNFIGF